jgi:dipeptidyl aminopeptidase/acylaminoacyl peptidase
MSRGMIPADLFRIQWVSDARIALDGRTLAFTVTRLDEEADDYRSAIWVVPADGSAPPRRFTSGGGKDSAPRWSPDGTRLVTVVRTGSEDEGSVQDNHKPKTPPARLITVLKYRHNGEGFTYGARQTERDVLQRRQR